MSKFLTNIFHTFDRAMFNRDVGIPGVKFPNEKIFNIAEVGSFFADLTGESSKILIKLATSLPKVVEQIHDLPKEQHSLHTVYRFFAEGFIPNKQFLPPNYNFFGVDDAKQLLIEFVKSNPFFASALKAHALANGDIEYHIRSVDGDNTWFSRVVAVHDEFDRVNVVFDSHFNVKSFEVVDRVTGAPNGKVLTEQIALGKLLYMLTFYFETVHTLIHILHVLLVAALVDSSRGCKTLSAFAGQYSPNVYLKFKEVQKLLIAEDSGLTGLFYKGDRARLLPIMSDMLRGWGSYTTAQEFLERSLLKDLLNVPGGRATLDRSGVLTEFFKHADLVPGFAHELDEVFRHDAQDYKKTTDALKIFLEDTGPNGLRVNNLKTWIEIMSLTGIIHGTTLSATRLCCNMAVFRNFTNRPNIDTKEDEKDEKHDKNKAPDAKTLSVALGTIVGMMEEHEVFTNLMQDECRNPLVRAVVLKYGGRSAAYKLDYFNRLKNDPRFVDYGFLWSDYCPDFIDGKQFTIDTYV